MVSKLSPDGVPASEAAPRLLALAAVVGICYWALASYSIAVGVYLAWPGDGLALGVLLSTRYRDWPYYLAAVFAGNYAAGSEAPAVNLLYSAFNTFEPLFVAAVASRVLGARPRLDSVSATFGLVALTLVSMALAILADNSIDWALHRNPFWSSWLEWYLSNALGMLVFAPLVVSWRNDLRAEWSAMSRLRRLEAATILAGLVIASWLPYAQIGIVDQWLRLARAPLLAPSLFLLWGAVRFALPGGTACLAIVTLLTMGFTGHAPGLQSGPGQDTPALFHLQLSLAVMAITMLIVSSVAAEWRGSRSRLDRALESARLALFEVDVRGARVFFSEGLAEMKGTGRGEAQVAISEMRELLHPDERDAIVDAASKVLSGERETYEAEHRIRRRDGEWSWVLSRGRIVERDAAGRALRVAGTQVDITERKLTEQRLHYLATRDALTTLTNRALFGDSLQQAVEEARGSAKRVAVLSVGLDRFTAINDSLGRAVGDQVLKIAAMRITSALDPVAVVARPGGDDFLVLLPQLDSPFEASEAAGAIRASISRPMRVENDELVVTAGIGIALFPEDGDSAGLLLRNADIALNTAKAGGRDRIQYFAPGMNQAARARLEMEQALRRGLEAGQFVIHYQPEIDLATGRLAGYEALSRWHDPQRGLVMPQDFIPAAEAMGLMDAFGERILHMACRDAAAWQRGTDLVVSVNVSPSQLRDRRFVETVHSALASSGLRPQLLELEITEGSIVEQDPHTTETLEALATLGVHIAVDDFGTGYSSLGYLKRLPLDKVKIDRSFVADLPGDLDAGAIVSAIIALSHNLGLRVVAEGVESPLQAEYLRERGCDLAQGYLFGRPEPIDASRPGLSPPGG